MQAVLRRQKGGHGPRRCLRKPRRLGMRVQQLVLSCARSSQTATERRVFGSSKRKGCHLPH